MTAREENTMTKEQDIEHSVVFEQNGYQIIRSVTRDFNDFTMEYYGRKKVWYDVCDEEDILDSFKTLREAKKSLKEILK